MAGKARLDTIAERITALERSRQDDVFGASLRSLSNAALTELVRRMNAGDDPAIILKEIGNERPD